MDWFDYLEAFSDLLEFVEEHSANSIVAVLNDITQGDKKVSDYNKGKFDAYTEVVNEIVRILKLNNVEIKK